jgi:hypothetical protein
MKTLNKIFLFALLSTTAVSFAQWGGKGVKGNGI